MTNTIPVPRLTERQRWVARWGWARRINRLYLPRDERVPNISRQRTTADMRRFSESVIAAIRQTTRDDQPGSVEFWRYQRDIAHGNYLRAQRELDELRARFQSVPGTDGTQGTV